MRQCLTSPDGGYYTTTHSSGKDPFGHTGDFTTGPEISQVYGELVALWLVAESMAQGINNSPLQLIELGPGRGTLMDDVLRVSLPYENVVFSDPFSSRRCRTSPVLSIASVPFTWLKPVRL